MKDTLSFPTRPFKTHGGASVPHRKNTAETETVRMPAPAFVTLPMSMHIGAPCVPTVKVGDTVYVGTKIGDSDSPMSSPIHSSVSGKVSKISKIGLSNGRVCDAVVIESDGEMTLDPQLKAPVCDTKEDFIKAVRESGLVGLGGAGFPVAMKLQSSQGRAIDTVIINGAECEPYITADYREAMENSWDVMSGIHTIKNFLGVSRVIIGVESNKPKAIAALKHIADNDFDPSDNIRVLTLKSNYPQGAEKILIKACTGRTIPSGGLPSDVGCVVMNISSVAFLARYLKDGIPLVARRLTVDGSAVAEPKNVFVPIGSSIGDVIRFCGGFKEEVGKVLTGGPMMGFAMVDDTMPVMKQNNAILAFNRKDAVVPEPSACIRCGRCVNACPMHLMPTLIERQVKQKNAESLLSLGIMNCMECGSCAFECPTGHQLVQVMRLGKSIVREAGAKK